MDFNYNNFTWTYDSKYLHKLLFVAVSGSHSYGWVTKDSDLDVRYVWIPTIEQALSLRYRGKIMHNIYNNIDSTSIPLAHYLKLLMKGNGNFLENLFQHKLYENEELVKKLQGIVKGNLHIGYLHHYLGYYYSLQKDMNIPSRKKRYGTQKLLLNMYRVLQAGMILAEFHSIEYNVKEQANLLGNLICLELLDNYLSNNKIIPKSVFEDLEALEIGLKAYIDKSKFTKLSPSVVYDRYYRSVLGVKDNMKDTVKQDIEVETCECSDEVHN